MIISKWNKGNIIAIFYKNGWGLISVFADVTEK